MNTATAATLTFRNQKNGVKGQTVHHDATNKFDCPIRALLRIVTYVKAHTTKPNTPLFFKYLGTLGITG